MLACYFPITYAPPASPGPDIITREQLVAGVAAALAAVPAFAPYALPLVLEKLGSSLRCGYESRDTSCLIPSKGQTIGALMHCMLAGRSSTVQKCKVSPIGASKPMGACMPSCAACSKLTAGHMLVW